MLDANRNHGSFFLSVLKNCTPPLTLWFFFRSNKRQCLFVTRPTLIMMMKFESMFNSIRDFERFSPNVSNSLVTLPNINNLSEAAAHLLRRFNIKVAHQPVSIVRQKLCNPVPHRAIQDRYKVIYQVDCPQCPAVYVGQKKRRLQWTCIDEQKALAVVNLTTPRWKGSHFFNLKRSKFHQLRVNSTILNVILPCVNWYA